MVESLINRSFLTCTQLIVELYAVLETPCAMCLYASYDWSIVHAISAWLFYIYMATYSIAEMDLIVQRSPNLPGSTLSWLTQTYRARIVPKSSDC